MVHELSPGDDHDGAGVVVEALVRVHGPGYHSGERQVTASMGYTRCVDAISEEGTDQPDLLL